jgi:hypothetical protein
MKEGVHVIQFPLNSTEPLPEIIAHGIKALGEESAKAQHLNGPITSLSRLLITRMEQRVYIMVSEGTCVGILRVGIKKLFFHDPKKFRMHPFNTLCVLDFFVKAKRQGIGSKLFDFMLHDTGSNINGLAYDRPSDDLRRFVRGKWNRELSMQPNNYAIVVPEFFHFCHS